MGRGLAPPSTFLRVRGLTSCPWGPPEASSREGPGPLPRSQERPLVLIHEASAATSVQKVPGIRGPRGMVEGSAQDSPGAPEGSLCSLFAQSENVESYMRTSLQSIKCTSTRKHKQGRLGTAWIWAGTGRWILSTQEFWHSHCSFPSPQPHNVRHSTCPPRAPRSWSLFPDTLDNQIYCMFWKHISGNSNGDGHDHHACSQHSLHYLSFIFDLKKKQ